MTYFVVINNTKEEMDHIDLDYADGQSLNDQTASPDGVTILSDAAVPAGTLVTQVTINKVAVGFKPTPVISAGGVEVNASLIYYEGPEPDSKVIVGTDITEVEDGDKD